MSVQYQGNYSYTLANNLDANTQKRYIMAVQRGKPILDAELSEIAFTAFTGLRNYIRANIGDGAIETSFKIVESVGFDNDFEITGGNGTFEQPAMLFVKGIPAIITGNFKYSEQSSVPALNNDRRTNSAIPVLTTPVSNRTDIVYMDLYFAEVSSEAGSEYQDTTIKDIQIGQQTSNRFRIVQDIRVVEGGSLPIDGNDGFGIYHRYLKLATISRTSGAAHISAGMIVDERKVTVALQNLTNGLGNIWVATLRTGTLDVDVDINMGGDLIPNVSNLSNLGDPTHRFANLYMASNIDSSGGLTVNHSGATGQALKITRTGISTGNLFNVNDVFVVDNSGLVSDANTTNSTSPTTGSVVLAGGLGIAKDAFFGGNLNVAGIITSPGGFGPVHITDTTQSTSAITGALIVDGGAGIAKNLNVGGSLHVVGDMTIDGTTTTVNSVNLVVTDKNILINKNGSDASSEGAGFTVERTGPFGSLIYRNSAQGKFAIGSIGSEIDIVVSTRSINVSSPITGGGDLSADRTIGINSSNVNTPNYVVQRDGSGNFSAGIITADLSGNATTSTTAANLNRSILVNGNGLSGGGLLNADRTITSNATETNAPFTIVFRDGSGNFSAGVITSDLIGNATTATAATTATTAANLNRSILVSGNGLSGGGLFNADRTITSNATDANTPSTIVFRDGSGNFNANVISATSVTTSSLSIGIPLYSGALQVQGGPTWTQNYGFGSLTLNKTIRVEGTGPTYNPYGAIAFGDADAVPNVFIAEHVDDGIMIHSNNGNVYSTGGNHSFYNSSSEVFRVTGSLTSVLSGAFDVAAGNVTVPAGTLTVSDKVTSSKYFLSLPTGQAQIILNHTAAGYASIQNDSANTWSLAFKSTEDSTLGTVKALTWNSSGTTTANGLFNSMGIITANAQIFARSTNTVNGSSFDRGGLIIGASGNDQVQIDFSNIQKVAFPGIAGALALNAFGGNVDIASVFSTTTVKGKLTVIDNFTADNGAKISAGNLDVDIGNLNVSAGDFTMSSSSSKIYERGRSLAMGDWTTFATTLGFDSGSAVYSSTYMIYTVIGNTLFVKIQVQWDTAVSLTGITFTLPFNVSATHSSNKQPAIISKSATDGAGTVFYNGLNNAYVRPNAGGNLNASGEFGANLMYELA